MLVTSRKDLRDNGWERVLNYFRSKSMWMLHYCTGCGAIELPPTMTSRWDMERFGIGPMATPRQADLLLITGYLSIKSLKRVIYTYEQMQNPKWLIAFGSCPLNGGIYYDSYTVINRLALYLPIDLSIEGCMPRPEAVINGFNTLMKGIEQGTAVGYKRYEQNYAWYKKNQDAVLNRTKPVFDSGVKQ
ncbi:MAG TPA: NADH-quinone oxidoreductase subunit NuoB [Firmicutes bacterium]|uniref:NADH-quinone oxidoreductase subunit B n=1 Tax=candidate division TA06 bacterium TaxID=2250710 RepID=A0A660S9H6_UNCT6|nr:MAG: NADH-quinone oxidoreductase subunit B [candidate division TA06 bacterium]HFD04968.1 NADH-quinone oxidoreductase subunit NuoB [Bacillota bacterium]